MHILTAEYKIQYLVSPGVATQQYDVRLYLFFTSELDAAETSFFSSLYACVRLHIPRVRCGPQLYVFFLPCRVLARA